MTARDRIIAALVAKAELDVYVDEGHIADGGGTELSLLRDSPDWQGDLADAVIAALGGADLLSTVEAVVAAWRDDESMVRPVFVPLEEALERLARLWPEETP